MNEDENKQFVPFVPEGLTEESKREYEFYMRHGEYDLEKDALIPDEIKEVLRTAGSNEWPLPIPKKARIPMESYRGHPVKAAYYTAGYPAGSKVRFIGPMNHAEMIVLDGKSLGWEQSDIMVMTGNQLIGMYPEFRHVRAAREVGDFVVYDAHVLPPSYSLGLSSAFGLSGQLMDPDKAMELNAARVAGLLKAIGKYMPDKKMEAYQIVLRPKKPRGMSPLM